MSNVHPVPDRYCTKDQQRLGVDMLRPKTDTLASRITTLAALA